MRWKSRVVVGRLNDAPFLGSILNLERDMGNTNTAGNEQVAAPDQSMQRCFGTRTSSVTMLKLAGGAL